MRMFSCDYDIGGEVIEFKSLDRVVHKVYCDGIIVE